MIRSIPLVNGGKMRLNTDKKLTILILLWVLDKAIILAMLLLMSCEGIDNDCNNNGAGQFVWECECSGQLMGESPGLGNDNETWFHCCNLAEDSCWYRILDND